MNNLLKVFFSHNQKKEDSMCTFWLWFARMYNIKAFDLYIEKMQSHTPSWNCHAFMHWTESGKESYSQSY